MMQVIEAVDLREIDAGRITQKSRTPFMTRHMKRVGVGGAVFSKRIVQSHGSKESISFTAPSPQTVNRLS